MPEKTITTYLAGLGLSIVGALSVFSVRQNVALRKDMVSEPLCAERRDAYQKGMEDKLDSVKDDTEKQWNALQEIRDITIETRTLLKERGRDT